jgi:hypothetical protein
MPVVMDFCLVESEHFFSIWAKMEGMDFKVDEEVSKGCEVVLGPASLLGMPQE